LSVLQCSGISLTYGSRNLLKDVQFSIDEGARIALAGANGSGKSTLLKILAGTIKADDGTIAKRGGTRVSYLAQHGVTFRNISIWEAAEDAFVEHARMVCRLDTLTEEIGKTTGGRQLKLSEEIHELQELIETSGYYARTGKIQAILEGLGFSATQFQSEVTTLSGGWQMRLALAQVLLQEPDVLLLDEPTNYLDLETREWLLLWLKRFKGALVLVSHDRYILETMVASVAELYQSRLKIYKGNYVSYENRRILELEQVIAAWKKQQDEIETLERFVERFGAKATKAKQAQSRVKMLEKMERIEIPDGLKKMHFAFPKPPSSGEVSLSIQDLGKVYGSRKILDAMNLDLPRGRKIAILGRNGAGKSTLLRMIAGVEMPDSGILKLGHNVKLAYFAQEAESTLNAANTILDEVEQAAPDNFLPQVRNLLGAFLFTDDDIYKPISVLSGGERSRVALVKMLLSPANLLVLDEPTNHLDLTSKDILLEALKVFPGTVVFVSHDRYFIRDLADSILELIPVPHGPAQWKFHDGNFEYFEWLQAKVLMQSFTDVADKSETGVKKNDSSNVSQNSLRREEDKKLKATIRKLEKEEEQLLLDIDELEVSKQAIEEQLCNPETYSKPDMVRAINERLAITVSMLLNKHVRWETVSAELENLLNA